MDTLDPETRRLAKILEMRELGALPRRPRTGRCALCRSLFSTTSGRAIYCSDLCRWRAYRARKAAARTTPEPSLSPTQRAVLALVARGATWGQVADELLCSRWQARAVARAAARALGARGRTAAVARALALGLIDPPT